MSWRNDKGSRRYLKRMRERADQQIDWASRVETAANRSDAQIAEEHRLAVISRDIEQSEKHRETEKERRIMRQREAKKIKTIAEADARKRCERIAASPKQKHAWIRELFAAIAANGDHFVGAADYEDAFWLADFDDDVKHADREALRSAIKTIALADIARAKRMIDRDGGNIWLRRNVESLAQLLVGMDNVLAVSFR